MTRSISRSLILAAAFAFTAPAVQADQITETIQSALDAYAAGDVQYAMDELAYAQQQLQALKADSLAVFLPEAADGWTRTVNTEMNAGLMMMGGGTGAEASYEGPGGSFKISLTADNPMVASMGAMLGNATLMAQMGKIERVGRQRFLNQDGSLSALIGNRVLVQAQGGDVADMLPALEMIDYAGLEKFGS
ncbi:hypothetical protein [Szabonella alba]|uniref:Uncharacterized protein n=1 Tax=Szabonella alba TaxID=2804194 RepID=A0A8K0Y145_9RHOB|nr:hypothetical protein [Szabonella alba]MBL4915634.1 hypothetical protein [Szabonella alba]